MSEKTVSCPQCKGKGRLNESMGSRETCGLCQGAGKVKAGGVLIESVSPGQAPSDRLTS